MTEKEITLDIEEIWTIYFALGYLKGGINFDEINSFKLKEVKQVKESIEEDLKDEEVEEWVNSE